jgi:LPS export ABC transporter protein LptC
MPTGGRENAWQTRVAGSCRAAVVLLAFLAGGCGRQTDVGPPQTTGALPDQEVSDFVLTETDEGAVQWKLYARYAATFNARNVVQVRGLRVDFFDEKAQRSSELTAREGELQLQTHDMTARGNVVLQTQEGTRMSTEELHFLNREQKIVSPVTQQVRIQHQGDVLTGFGFESDPQLRHYEFKKSVRATVRTESGGDILERRKGAK